jgi:hypothetical protein
MPHARVLAVALAVLALAAPAALANGDPPSDVLITADVYPPAEPASPALVSDLRSAAKRAKDAGYPAKVAVVQSAIDLGNVAQAFGRPQQYADYLGSDLNNHPDVRGEFALLVVMPAGSGLAGIGGKDFDEDERRAARTIDVRTGANSNELVRAATVTLEKMAAEGGHPIGGAGGSGDGGSSAGVIIGVLGGLLALTAVAVVAARARSRASSAEPPPE